MRDLTSAQRAAPGCLEPVAPPRRPSLAVQVAGLAGAAVIGLTLGIARLWSRLTRAPFYDD